MNRIDDIQKTLNFIENNLLDIIGADDVSKHINTIRRTAGTASRGNWVDTISD